MRLNFFLLLLAVFAIGLTTLWLDQDERPLSNVPLANNLTSLQKNQKAPDFSFETLDGRKSSLSAFRGTPIVLHFWASWCAPCVAEFPSLLKMAEKKKSRILVLAISTDRSPEKIKSFLKKQNKRLPANVMIIWDEHKTLTEDLFQTFKLPETIILDRAGNMVRKEAGQTDWLSPDVDVFLKSLSED